MTKSNSKRSHRTRLKTLKKKSRRKVREDKNQAIKLNRQLRIRALLRELEIWDEIDCDEVEAYLLRVYNQPISIQFGTPQDCDALSNKVMRELRQALARATVEVGVLNAEVSVADYASYVLPLCLRLKRFLKIVPARLKEKFEACASCVSDDAIWGVITEIYHLHLAPVLINHGRLDGCLYYLDWACARSGTDRGKHEFLLNRVRPEQRIVIKDNERRRTYRCGRIEYRNVEWTEWTSSTIGILDEVKSFPVFVQQHAIDRLQQRVGGIFPSPGIDGMLHLYLADSLENPVVARRCPNGIPLLVEYRLDDYKLGYLATRKIENLILVETFLFLTMDGTPEGDLLQKYLQLERSGKQYTGLDELGTFLASDVAADPELVELLSSCGCGHLFELGKLLQVESFAPGYAADVRRILRLKSSDALTRVD